MGLYQRLWQNLGLHQFVFYYLMPSSGHGLSLLVETRKTVLAVEGICLIAVVCDWFIIYSQGWDANVFSFVCLDK